MADNATIRLLIGDRKKIVEREIIFNTYNVNRLIFQLDKYPLASSAASEGPTGSVIFFQNDVAISESGASILSGDVGRCTLASALAAGKEITANYDYYAISSGEIDDLLSGHTGSPYLVAANACLVLAADAAKLYAYTQGDKSVDQRKTSTHLRELSAQYESRHYGMLKDINYTTTVVTFKDNTGTPYYGYDSASAYLTGTS